MKTTTIDGFSSRPSLREIAPEAPALPCGFAGLRACDVALLIGPSAAEELYRMEHDDTLEFHRDMAWREGKLWYTPAGLTRIAEEFSIRGAVIASFTVRNTVRQRIAALEGAPDPVIARRWDLNTEAMA